MEKDDGPKAATPGFVQDALTFLPRKWRELRSFLSEVEGGAQEGHLAELAGGALHHHRRGRPPPSSSASTSGGSTSAFSEVLSRFLKR